MSITTAKGDSGNTTLLTGELVRKDDLRVEAYGTLDELDAHLGEARQAVSEENVRQILLEIQQDLFRLMGELACKSKPYAHPVTEEEVNKLTDRAREWEQKVHLEGLVIPGNTPQSAKLDVCRTITRRAERRIVTLSQSEPVSDFILQYINRLSDLLFILARWFEQKEDAILYAKNK